MSHVSMAPPSMPQARTPDHAGTITHPAPLAGRAAYRVANPTLAERGHRHDWPDSLQRLQRACRMTYEAYAELDELAAPTPHDSPLARLAQGAWLQWLALEELGALALVSMGEEAHRGQ
ncbi:MAG: hypothetical protein IVW57_04470 [Ktedonobacterales bacterium]|nr:hypothetical protein [Ktedonobacterales bacterium]